MQKLLGKHSLVRQVCDADSGVSVNWSNLFPSVIGDPCLHPPIYHSLLLLLAIVHCLVSAHELYGLAIRTIFLHFHGMPS